MKRELRVTEDGSHTLYIEDLEETYHSIHGAIQESRHVFIENGLLTVEKSSVRILETGLGTGLNLLLPFMENLRLQKKIFYHAVEKYPLKKKEYTLLNYENILHSAKGLLQKIHSTPWHEEIMLDDRFSFLKEKADFRSMLPAGKFDLVYFDAFAPSKQPQLWTHELFDLVGRVMKPGGILVTYSSRGEVRRTLAECDFQVQKLPGPPGKREMIRAVRN